MKRKLFLIAFISLLLSSCGGNKNKKNYAELVDPMIGTAFHGHTYPGAVAPFGMVQVSPDTRIGMTWDGCSGYHYSDSVIYGFSHTHLSGTGCFDLCDVLMMPTTGELHFSNDISNGTSNSYVSRFSHDNENASAGYYSVVLDDYNIKAELTATERTGYHKYTYPEGQDANVIIDLTHQDKVLNSSLKIENKKELSGKRVSQHWAEEQRLYFVMQFSHAFDESGIVFNGKTITASEAEGQNVKGFVKFKDLQEPLYVKVGISAVSIENARANIDKNMSFESALAASQKMWNKELGKIDVEMMDHDDEVVFYTSLYHTMVSPNLYSDANGDYLGRDMNVYNSDDDYYTVFSLWDTYRALHPLHSIINQKRTNDFINTFLLQYKHSGRLPVWELWSNETNCMIGYHAVPVIYDAYMKGVDDYDVKYALQAMKATADSNIFGVKSYVEKGFLATETEHESVSKTLEYAYDDWCIAMMSKKIGDDEGYRKYIKRAQSYKNLFDTETGFHRAKTNNMWFTPFDPKEVNFNYTEANCWQYNFHVQQDVNTLISLFGGYDLFEQKLDNLFNESSEMTGRVQSDITGIIGQYAHGNEPSHHVAYLYNYAGSPYKTQKVVRQIMDEMYFNAPDGLCGNEDCGQMSAWYVFSALGFYPVCPGDNQLIFGSPKVKSAVINLENEKEFLINVENQSDNNIYIDRVEINGVEYKPSYITYPMLLNGGEITFYMTDVANEMYGKAEQDRPKNVIADNLINLVPYFTNSSAVFNDKVEVNIASPVANCDIYYTLDGSEPTKNSLKFEEPIILKETATVKAISYNAKGVGSEVVETKFSKIPNNRKIELKSKYENQYSGGGHNALIDYKRGGNNFRTGGWQGYQGQDIVAIVDLGKKQKVSEVGMGFLQDVKSWIFYPTEVEVYYSTNGRDYKEYGKILNTVTNRTLQVTTQELAVKGDASCRYVKVVAKTIGVCPAWHESAGGSAWIFADEIIIK